MSAGLPDQPTGRGGDHWDHFSPPLGPGLGLGLGLRGVGANKARAFEQVGLALTATITDPARVRLRSSELIRCSAADDQGLLLAWIDTLLGRMAVHHLLFGAYRVRLGPGALAAMALGEPLDAHGGSLGIDLHQVLCDQLSLMPGPAQTWRAEVILSVERP